MELFQNLISAPQNASEKEVEDNITTLVDRLAHSTLVSDRRGAILAMKSFSRQYREIVIAKGVKQLLAILNQDSYDVDIVKAILETLLILFIRGESDSDLTRDWINSQSRMKNGKYPSPSILVQNIKPDQFSLWIADELTQSTENLELLIEMLEFDDVHIKIYALQLLQALVSTRRARTQELILKSPTAISKLCSILDDLFEPIRNEAILLLMGLVKDNFNIQKLVVFENTFDKLYKIIHEEGGIDGTIVVQDCLSLISNLLNYNSSNQKFFIETNCLKQLVSLINECLDASSGYSWKPQMLDNLITTLDTCRLFIVKDTQDIHTLQDAMVNNGAMLSCLRLVFSLNVPNDIKVIALMTVSDIIRGNNEAQFKFSQVDVPYIDPSLPSPAQKIGDIVPINVALLYWCLHLNSVHCFDIRAAAAYTLHAFFKDNNEAKLAFLDDQIYAFNFLNGINVNHVSTEPVARDVSKKEDVINKLSLTIESLDARSTDSRSVDSDTETDTTSIDLNGLEAKVNIFQTLVEVDNYKINPYKIWFASIILLYIMEDYPEIKLKILAINLGLEDEDDDNIIYLLPAISQALCTSLKQSDIRVPIAYLMLLSYICWESYEAVDEFLKDPSVIDQFLAYIVDPINDSALPQGLLSFFLSEVYEFTRSTSPLSRVQLHALLSKRVGIHSLSLKIQQIQKNSYICNFNELDWIKPSRDESGLPEVYFDQVFVYLMKENAYRIAKAIGVDPNIIPPKRLDYSSFEVVQTKLRVVLQEYERFKADSKELSDKQMKQLAESASDFNQLTAKHEKLMSGMHEITLQRDELVDKLSQSVKEADKLKEMVASLEAKVESMSEDLKRTSISLKKCETDRIMYKEKFEIVDKAKSTAENGINKMSRELMNLTAEKASTEKKIANLEKEVSNLKGLLENSKKEVTNLMTKNNDFVSKFESQVETLTSELNSAKGEASKLRTFITEKDKRIAELEQNASDLVSKLRSAAGIIEDLKNQKTNKDKEFSQYKENVTNEIRDLKITMLELQKSKKSLEEETECLRKERDKLNDELTSAFEDSSHLQEETSREIEALNNQLSKIKDQYEKSELVNRQLEENNFSLKTKIDGMKAENEENLKFHEKRSKELEDESNSRIQELRAQLDLSESEVHKLGREIHDIQSKLSTANSSIKILAEAKDKLEAEKDTAMKKNKELEQEKESLSEQLRKDKSDNKVAVDQKLTEIANLEQVLKQKEFELERLSQKLAAFEDGQDATTKELSATISDLNLELQQLKRFKTDNERKLAELEKDVSVLTETKLKLESDLEVALTKKDHETQKMGTTIKELTANIEKLASDSKSLEDENALLKAKYDTLSGLEKKLNEQTEITRQLEIQLEKLASEKDKMEKSLQSSVFDLKKDVESKDVSNSKLTEQVESLQTFINKLKSENVNIKNEVEKSKEKEAESVNRIDEISKLQSALELERMKNEKLSDESNKLKSDYNSRREEVNKLTNIISSLTTERDEILVKLADMESTKSVMQQKTASTQSRLDELLLLWTEATEKAASYKQRLIDIGEEVASSEDEDEGDEGEEDEEDEEEEEEEYDENEEGEGEDGDAEK